MSIETDYEPTYVGLEDVPISGPDDYSSEEKRKALFHAESSLELDVNGGEEIPQDEIIEAHRAAVMNLATYLLTGAAEEPSDVTLGDMASGGGDVTEYSNEYKAEYERLIDKINESGIGSSEYGNFTMAVNAKNEDI